MANKYTLEHVRKHFEEQGCELLATEYKNPHIKLPYKCRCGNHAEIRWNDVLRRCSINCSQCRYEKASKSLRLDYEYVQQYFKDQGCKLLEKEYKNARQLLRYRCSCGNVSKIKFYSFKDGHRCRKCSSAKIADKQRLTYGYVYRYFKENNCELLEKEYINAATPMKYRCECGNVAMIRFNQFSKGGRCWECRTDKISGENNYQWRSDREKLKLELDFKQKCYKMLRRVLGEINQKKISSTEKMLGYSHNQLIEHITNHERWEEVKDEKWHLDHVFPMKAFFDCGIYDIKLINSLDNLQPLLVSENCSKNAKYNKIEFKLWLSKKGIFHET